MRRTFLLIVLAMLPWSALADEPSARARAERDRTIARRHDRGVRRSAIAATRQVAMSSMYAAMSSQAIQLQARNAAAQDALLASLRPPPIRPMAPIIVQPDYVIYTRGSDGKSRTSYVYSNTTVSPPLPTDY